MNFITEVQLSYLVTFWFIAVLLKPYINFKYTPVFRFNSICIIIITNIEKHILKQFLSHGILEIIRIHFSCQNEVLLIFSGKIKA